MEKRRMLYAIDWIYLAIMTLCSLFYLFANFDKAISKQLGFAQFMFSIIVICAFLAIRKFKEKGLHVYIYIIYSVAQLVPVFNWFVYLPATFHIFPGIIAINWIGLLFHLLLIAWGICTVIFRQKIKKI